MARLIRDFWVCLTIWLLLAAGILHVARPHDPAIAFACGGAEVALPTALGPDPDGTPAQPLCPDCLPQTALPALAGLLPAVPLALHSVMADPAEVWLAGQARHRPPIRAPPVAARTV